MPPFLLFSLLLSFLLPHTTCKSLPVSHVVSHVTAFARSSILRYLTAGEEHFLVPLGGSFPAVWILRIDGRANKVTWDTGNDLQVASPDEGEQSHVTLFARASIRRYPNGRGRALLSARALDDCPLSLSRGRCPSPFSFSSSCPFCSPSSGDTTCKSLPVSHVTVFAWLSIRRYPDGRRRASLCVCCRLDTSVSTAGRERLRGTWATIFKLCHRMRESSPT